MSIASELWPAEADAPDATPSKISSRQSLVSIASELWPAEADAPDATPSKIGEREGSDPNGWINMVGERDMDTRGIMCSYPT